MKSKTISAHYDSVYSLDHNNRKFIPKNVDFARIQNNYNLVNAGDSVNSFFPDIKDLNALRDNYRQLTQAYWRSYREEQEELSNKLREILRQNAKFQMVLWELLHCDYDSSPLAAIISLLLLPLVLTVTIASSVHTIEEVEKIKAEKRLLQSETYEFRWTGMALRDALREKDRVAGTSLLCHMDELVWKSEIIFEVQTSEPVRFATIEEVYQKVFEPDFQAFQAKQRKCRRYNGTYLEQIRERQRTLNKGKNKNEKIRASSEAFEIVFGIGDMDNTGYAAAPEDAKKSEALLTDFCQHLLAQPNVCTVTTRELNDPSWKPPFKHGLILVNLVGHFDEATPGIHATFIPYSRGCKRGPDAQSSLGRTFTGMGYPSTWKDVLDPDGNPVLKTDRYGKPILNEDGSVRTKKEPEKQGIIDWIEDQKEWLQGEMRKRYSWDREYKGSHPRGNLSVPDYKVARAQERIAEAEQHMKQLLQRYYKRCSLVANSLQQSIENSIENDSDLKLILSYARTCSDERYEELLREAVEGLEYLSAQERTKAKQTLQNIINIAEGKHQHAPVPDHTNNHTITRL